MKIVSIFTFALPVSLIAKVETSVSIRKNQSLGFTGGQLFTVCNGAIQNGILKYL